jgi:hypothetical protein
VKRTLDICDSEEGAMSSAAYAVQMAAAEKALELARETGDMAAVLAALATMTRLVRLQYNTPSQRLERVVAPSQPLIIPHDSPPARWPTRGRILH